MTGEDENSIIEKVDEVRGDENKINFIVHLKAKLQNIQNKDIVKTFKLQCSISTSNMYLFSTEGELKKYDRAEDDFVKERIIYYAQRLDYLKAICDRTRMILSNKII